MQNRFKFRVKFKTDNKIEIFDVIDINFETQQVFFRRQDGKVYNIGLGVKGTELIQCTGLKDENGKLIYEGDIVKFSSIYGHALFEIKWNNEFATFGYEDTDTDFSEFGRLYQEAPYVEILGNIYENKELLGGANES